MDDFEINDFQVKFEYQSDYEKALQPFKDNAITNVEVVQDEYETVFSIFVYADDTRINLVTYEGDDNGYYGTGYYLRVKVNIGG